MTITQRLRLRLPDFLTTLALGLVMSTGCVIPLAGGARTIFADSTVCPVARVSVEPSALPPHEVLGLPSITPPSEEIAADAERRQVWERMVSQQWQVADRDNQVFAVEGCGKKTVYACARPTIVQVYAHDGLLTGDTSVTMSDGRGVRVLSAVRCVPSASSTADAAAQLASLPHVESHYDIPPAPAALRGLSVRLHASVAGAPDGGTIASITAGCVAGVAEWTKDLGWTIVSDPNAPVDLDMSFSCNGHVEAQLVGDAIQFKMPPESAQATTTFVHAGQVIEQFPHGPLAFICDAAGTPEAKAASCIARVKQWSQARFFGELIGSVKLADFAAHRASGGATP